MAYPLSNKVYPLPKRALNLYYPQPPLPRLRPPQYQPSDSAPWKTNKDISILLDKSLTHAGDLGWTIDYATAWLYRHIIDSTPSICDTIDHVRELGHVSPKTPYYTFNYLDKALFGNKLKGMVYLRWKDMASCTTGTTSAPGIVDGIARVCIELNRSPFEECADMGGEADIDDLLEALIHQMVHAFFLVTCGAQKKTDKDDGRLGDGVHFGVVLLTIKDITKNCADGPLELIFYAHRRRELEGRVPLRPPFRLDSRSRRQRSYVALSPADPSSTNGPAPPSVSGQTDCMASNRHITLAALKNWQVTAYSLALDLNLSVRGEEIYDLSTDGVLVKHTRLHAPPSITYVELLWDEKRVMIPREKTIRFPSLVKVIKKAKLPEVDVPAPCSFDTFKAVYDFIQKGECLPTLYDELRSGGPSSTDLSSSDNERSGPPVWNADKKDDDTETQSILSAIKTFKVAENMKFTELQSYMLHKLWSIQSTSDDPIVALKELYNDNEPNAAPIHSGLHRWARKFLARRQYIHHHHSRHHHHNHRHQQVAVSNYALIAHHFPTALKAFFNHNPAFAEDCLIVANELRLDHAHAVGVMREGSSSSLSSLGSASLSSSSTFSSDRSRLTGCSSDSSLASLLDDDLTRRQHLRLDDVRRGVARLQLGGAASGARVRVPLRRPDTADLPSSMAVPLLLPRLAAPVLGGRGGLGGLLDSELARGARERVLLGDKLSHDEENIFEGLWTCPGGRGGDTEEILGSV